MCGFTNAADIKTAVALGVDAIGLVFYPPSKRFVALERAIQLAESIPFFVSTVALFVDQTEQQVKQVLNAMPVSLLQFHGNESAAYCESFERPYIKVVSVPVAGDEASLSAIQNSIYQQIDAHPNARGFLLDSKLPTTPGGTGLTFDWRVIPNDLTRPVVLAGGLSPSNVKDAIDQVEPFAVDVSSGIESAPGRKDAALMAQFVEQVRAANDRH